MKFAAWRKVLSIFLLAVFLCAVPSLLTACSRSPASGSTELLDSTQLYFIELGRLVPGFEQTMLDSFREAAEKLDACVKAHDAYFAEYPDAKAACALMVQLPDVLEQFIHLRAVSEATAEVDVISAAALSEQQLAKISAAMEKRLSRKVKLNCKIDKSVMAGVIIRAGDMVIDGSVRGRLERLADVLQS